MEVYNNKNLDYMIKLSDAADGEHNINSLIKSVTRYGTSAMEEFMNMFFMHFSSGANRYIVLIKATVVNEITIFMINNRIVPNNVQYDVLEKELNFEYVDTVDFNDYFVLPGQNMMQTDYARKQNEIIKAITNALNNDIALKLTFNNLDEVMFSTKYFGNAIKYNTKVYREHKKIVVFLREDELSEKPNLMFNDFCDVEIVSFTNIDWTRLKYITTYNKLRKVMNYCEKN